jgi:GNAT superfamily N-acetyltransferase
MTDVADLLARAEAALAELPPGSPGSAAMVSGIPCVSLPIDQPWATQAKAMVPPHPAGLDQVIDWLSGHAHGGPDQWVVTTRERHARLGVFTDRGLSPWLELPTLVLGSVAAVRNAPHVAGLEVGKPASAEEFLAVYGTELSPLVSPAVLASASHHLLVGRMDGVPVACAQVREVLGTAYICAVTVLPECRGRGIGRAISTAATRYALGLEPRAVWLSAVTSLHGLYGALGFRAVDVHVQLRPNPPAAVGS